MKKNSLLLYCLIIWLVILLPVPGCAGSDQEQVKTVRDEASLRSLNSVTLMYRQTTDNDDPFSHPDADSPSLMSLLVPLF